VSVGALETEDVERLDVVDAEVHPPMKPIALPVSWISTSTNE
jgi:hypothetical protein